VDQLAAGERAMAMHGLGHMRQGRDVMVVPEPRLLIGRDIAGGMDLAFLGADHGPAALGLHAAHGRQRQRHVVAHAVAMGHLVEAVAGGDGADLDRLEQDIVTRIARHSGPPERFLQATLARRSAKKQAAPGRLPLLPTHRDW
jgi:hypothetical protein